jgi:hypothetical protein
MNPHNKAYPMKIFLTLFIVLFNALNIFSQTYSVSGQIADSSTKKPLGKANVIFSHQPDLKVRGIITDEGGRFRVENLTRGRYLLTVSFLGYKSYKRNIEIDREIELPKIYLIPEGVELKEVEIIGKTSGVTIKNDTTEYSADAFKVNKDAVAEDLIEKMPGIAVQQDGTVQAHGETVTNVLVDGKMFFGSDPNAALKNIPAEIIEKIQVFDQQSEQSQFTGFDDGNTSKTINIVTRLRVKQGTFGKLFGGYGDLEKYSTGGNINFFNDDQRISLLTQFNNVNIQNFSSEDLLGVMSSSGQGGRREMGGGMGNRGRGSGGRGSGGGNPGFGSGQGGPGGSNASNFLVSQTAGLITTKAIGLNYADKWGESIDINGSYFFNLTGNNAESSTDRNYFLTSNATQNYNQDNSSLTKNSNHRLNFRLNYQIDTSNSILFHPAFTAQLNNGASNNLANTISGLNLLSSTASLFNTDLTALNFTNELLYRHKFELPGRTISLDFNGTYNKNSGDNNLFAENLYYNNNDSLTSSDTISQVSDLLKQGFSVSSGVVYTEPINEYGLLQFNTKYSYSADKSDKSTYDIIANSSPLDTGLSNVYKKYYVTQSLGTGYRFRKDNLSFAVGLNYNVSQLRNEQTYPYSLSIGKSFYSILPSFMFQYRVSKDQNLRFFYRTNNDDPSIDQLQEVLNNSNPTQLTIGNPNLAQDHKHSFNLRYTETGFDNVHSFFVLLGATFTQNYIGNSTTIAQQDTTVLNGIVLNKGSELTTPVNLNGYINFRSLVTYGLPVSLLMSNINFSLGVNYTQTPTIINGINNRVNSITYSGGIVLSSNFSEKIDFTFSSMSSLSLVKDNMQTVNNSNYFNQHSKIKLYLWIWDGFILQNEINHQYDNGLSSSYNRNIVLWNLSLGKKFLANDNGEIRLSVYDLLNKNTSIQHNITDSYIEDVRSNTLGRYYLLSFIYNIRTF